MSPVARHTREEPTVSRLSYTHQIYQVSDGVPALTYRPYFEGEPWSGFAAVKAGDHEVGLGAMGAIDGKRGETFSEIGWNICWIAVVPGGMSAVEYALAVAGSRPGDRQRL
jgi:hypothetical protein